MRIQINEFIFPVDDDFLEKYPYFRLNPVVVTDHSPEVILKNFTKLYTDDLKDLDDTLTFVRNNPSIENDSNSIRYQPELVKFKTDMCRCPFVIRSPYECKQTPNPVEEITDTTPLHRRFVQKSDGIYGCSNAFLSLAKKLTTVWNLEDAVEALKDGYDIHTSTFDASIKDMLELCIGRYDRITYTGTQKTFSRVAFEIVYSPYKISTKEECQSDSFVGKLNGFTASNPIDITHSRLGVWVNNDTEIVEWSPIPDDYEAPEDAIECVVCLNPVTNPYYKFPCNHSNYHMGCSMGLKKCPMCRSSRSSEIDNLLNSIIIRGLRQAIESMGSDDD